MLFFIWFERSAASLLPKRFLLWYNIFKSDGFTVCSNRFCFPKGAAMKSLSFFLKKILTPACVFFTVIVTVLALAVSAAADQLVNLNLASLAMCFVAGLCLSLTDRLLYLNKISFILRLLLHMSLSVLSVSLTVALFSLVGGILYPATSRSFYLVLALITVYFVLIFPFVLIRHALEKRNAASEMQKKDSRSSFQK